MKTSTYQAKVMACRILRDRTQTIAEQRIYKILEKAFSDLTILMSMYEKQSLTYANYAAKRAGIARIINQMSSGIETTTRLGFRGVAEDVAGTYQDLTESFARSKGYSFDFNEAFATVPVMATRNTLGRIWLDGQNFSDRVWNLRTYANEQINNIISSGISRGESAVNMAKELKTFLVSRGTAWTTAAVKSKTGRGTIDYNALRLARTEINNTYRETLALSNEANPVTLGVRWNLSASHPRPDVCDLYANVDEYGLGPGVYPPDRVPIDHPNGMCYITEVLRPASQWDKPKPEVQQRRLSQGEVLSVLSGQSEGTLNAAYAQYQSNQRLISMNLKRMRKAA